MAKLLIASFVAAAALAAGPAPAGARDAELDSWRAADDTTVSAALALGRRAFDAYAERREVIDPPDNLPPLLRRRAAVFVSAMRDGAPRACMGTLTPAEPDAAHEIVASAVAAAGRDRRFPPVKPAELRGLTLIVSIVGSSRPIAAAEIPSLDPTREGLAARYAGRFGVVLSRETTRTDRMIAWARIRAGAPTGRHVDYFRLQDVRFVENERRPHR
ncbi:MAG TPA: AMMECR1 domain-containing protein [Chthonomonadaceae bacterium]|nr:AMMECR1 domain-containing protein [Chthonomonadaceae bacterium]